jgi:hypothetical protein
MDAYLRQQADQPFGDAFLASGRNLAPYSQAGMAAAENLLTKADRALGRGELDRARHFVARAAALNYDDHEKTAPAARTVHMMLFNAVVDELEDADRGDSQWLEAAEAALAASDAWGRSELRHILHLVSGDYVIERKESRRIATMGADVPRGQGLPEAAPSPTDLADAVMSVLATLALYREALERS